MTGFRSHLERGSFSAPSITFTDEELEIAREYIGQALREARDADSPDAVVLDRILDKLEDWATS